MLMAETEYFKVEGSDTLYTRIIPFFASKIKVTIYIYILEMIRIRILELMNHVLLWCHKIEVQTIYRRFTLLFHLCH